MSLFKYFTIKKELELEIKHLNSIIEIERRKLQGEYDILATKKTLELNESLKIMQVELQEKLNKQATLYNESLQKMEVIHTKELSKLESRLAREYYEKMTEVVRELNLEGNVQTKFVQELSLKMFDKALEKPMPPSHFIQERILTER